MALRVRTSRSGVTLLECLLAAVILAMTVSAIIMPFAAGAQCAQEDARLTLAVNLAQDIMEEILARPFVDPDGDESAENSRSCWDDMDDYDGYSEPEWGIASFDGTAVTDGTAAGLTRHVTVKGVYLADQDVSDPQMFLRVIVEVRYRSNTLVTLTRLVYGHGTAVES